MPLRRSKGYSRINQESPRFARSSRVAPDWIDGVPEQPLIRAERPVSDIHSSEAVASTSLLSLAANIATMKRLLGRRDDGGALIPAEAELIRLTIKTAREEAVRVSSMLVALPDDPADPHRDGVATLLKAVADLDVVLDVLMDAVSRLDG